MSLRVAPLLRRAEGHAAHVDGVLLLVVVERDGRDVRPAVGSDRRHAPQGLLAQVPDLGGRGNANKTTLPSEPAHRRTNPPNTQADHNVLRTAWSRPEE